MDRLEKQLKFIYEIDKVKSIVRKTRLFHTDRYENDAEHSWHISMMAAVLGEYSNNKVDISRVIKMMLVHDLVEIDTDDKIVYQKTDADAIQEEKAARRIFGLLPEDQAEEYYGLWMEFEEQKTAESKFAMSLDRMEPLLQNICRNGEDWRKNGISYEQVVSVNTKIEKGSEKLWEFIKNKIDDCIKSGGFEGE